MRRHHLRRLALATAAVLAVSGGAAAADTMPRDDVAAWADTDGLTGLSPASVGPPPSPPTPPDQSGVAAWATELGLTGLSPASVG